MNIQTEENQGLVLLKEKKNNVEMSLFFSVISKTQAVLKSWEIIIMSLVFLCITINDSKTLANLMQMTMLLQKVTKIYI